MNLTENYTHAVCRKLPIQTLIEVFAMIYRADVESGMQQNYYDPIDNISYCVSIVNGTLAVSTVDYGPLPNASLLPVLSERFGDPDRMLSKPWYQDAEFTFFVMYWDSFNIKTILH